MRRVNVSLWDLENNFPIMSYVLMENFDISLALLRNTHTYYLLENGGQRIICTILTDRHTSANIKETVFSSITTSIILRACLIACAVMRRRRPSLSVSWGLCHLLHTPLSSNQKCIISARICIPHCGHLSTVTDTVLCTVPLHSESFQICWQASTACNKLYET